MPQSNVDRLIERSSRPWRTNAMTSLRADSGWPNLGRAHDLLSVLVGPREVPDALAALAVPPGDHVAGNRCVRTADRRRCGHVVDRRRHVERLRLACRLL